MTERDEFEKWCDLTERDPTNLDLLAAWQASRRAALEQAAKVCDSVNNFDNPMTASDCAAAIRALSQQDPQ
ncbi:hypothetical protein PQQ84_22475 [Paraburkholderia strydomiana]|uniref:hypothetical protein n=1 Tax=Paraburkholderia strydomiana TaxID=1245417 RepID=UPI0038BC4467